MRLLRLLRLPPTTVPAPAPAPSFTFAFALAGAALGVLLLLFSWKRCCRGRRRRRWGHPWYSKQCFSIMVRFGSGLLVLQMCCVLHVFVSFGLVRLVAWLVIEFLLDSLGGGAQTRTPHTHRHMEQGRMDSRGREREILGTYYMVHHAKARLLRK